MALKPSIGDDADFRTVPKGSIRVSTADGERQDRYDDRGDVYTVTIMQQQPNHPEREPRLQQMR